MAITNEHIEKYQGLCRKYFGKEVSADEAYLGCTKLLQLIKAIYKPMTVEQLKTVRLREIFLNNGLIDDSTKSC